VEGDVIPKVRILVEQLTTTVASAVTLVHTPSARRSTTGGTRRPTSWSRAKIWIIRCWISSATFAKFISSPLPVGHSLHPLHQHSLSSEERRNSHLESRSVVLIESLQTLDEEERRREPDRSSPVTVATEHAALRVSRPVVDAEFLAVDLHRPGILLVVTREPANRFVSEGREGRGEIRTIGYRGH
jgi:hypothetical protein